VEGRQGLGAPPRARRRPTHRGPRRAPPPIFTSYRTYDTGAVMKRRGAVGAAAPEKYHASKGTPCEAALEASVARLSAAANRTVCDLVAVDFTCFDLPRSPSCA